MADPLIPKGSTILVTGANSFIASHIADQLLSDGFHVRGSVRSNAKGEALQTHFHKTYGASKFEYVVVEDITEDGAFDAAVKDVTGICHVATAATMTKESDPAIAKTVAGATSILRSAVQAQSIKSFVYTSDSYAVLLPAAHSAHPITTATYNDHAIHAVQTPSELEKIKAGAWDPSRAIDLVVWAAVKAHAEKAVWAFNSSHPLPFHLASVIPNMNFGPPVGELPLTSTGRSIPDLLLNAPDPELYFPSQYFVNVRDCAKVHIAALLDASRVGSRLFACAEMFGWNEVLEILREMRPEREIRRDFEGVGRGGSVLPNSEAEGLLRKWYGHGWTGLRETVRQNIAGY